MIDTDMVEANAKKHPEDVTVIEDLESKREPILVDGKQLAFEGMNIDEIVSRLLGDLAIDPAEGGDRYERKGALVRLELTAKLRQVRIKSKRVGSVEREIREQLYEPLGPIECFETNSKGTAISHISRTDLMQQIWNLEDKVAELEKAAGKRK